MKIKKDLIYNAHLDGSDFFWESGNIGVLLIHGYTATTAEIRPLAKVLYNKGYTVAGPLIPGHYTQPEDLNHVHWQDWVNSTNQAYFRLKNSCDRVIVGGESLGGLLALYLASQYLEITAVLTYAPALRLNRNIFQLWLIRILAKFNLIIHKRNFGEDKFWQGYYSYPLQGTKQLLALQSKVQKNLPRITQPILIVQGKLDPTVHPEVPSMIYDNVRSCITEVHLMENSKHCVLIDQEMDKVEQITLDFLSSILK